MSKYILAGLSFGVLFSLAGFSLAESVLFATAIFVIHMMIRLIFEHEAARRERRKTRQSLRDFDKQMKDILIADVGERKIRNAATSKWLADVFRRADERESAKLWQMIYEDESTHEIDAGAIEAMLASEDALAENWLSDEDNAAYDSLGEDSQFEGALYEVLAKQANEENSWRNIRNEINLMKWQAALDDGEGQDE